MATRSPRSVDDRIKWFLTHTPDIDNDGDYDSGACANHTWKSLGGDYGNPPRWGKPTANAVIDALSVYGIRHLDMPYTSQTVWSAIQSAKGGQA